MTEGAKDDPAAPAAVKLEILPGARVLNAPAKSQQVAVVAHYADGSSRDVTPTCYYNSSNPEIAEVDADGFVGFKNRGEVAVIAHYLDLVANVRLTYLVEVPGFKVAEVPQDNTIDRTVFAKLNRMRISPSETCTDAEFIRRASLDALGILPTPDEVRAFLADPAPDRRAKLVDRLLARPEFADFWTLKFADILRANGRLIETKGTHAFNRWIKANLEQNTPIDRFVRELLTANGSTLRNPAANYYRISRDPENATETTAQLFLGVRIQCAKCHNHPFERWTQDDYYGFAAFFSRIKQKPGSLPEDEVIFADQRGRGPPAPDRQDDEAQGARRPGLRRLRLARPEPARPPRVAGPLAHRPGEPVLRQEPGQPRLVSPDGPGDRRAGRRLPRLQPRLQRRAARRPDRRLRQGRVRPQGARPLDPGQPDLPAFGAGPTS